MRCECRLATWFDRPRLATWFDRPRLATWFDRPLENRSWNSSDLTRKCYGLSFYGGLWYWSIDPGRGHWSQQIRLIHFLNKLKGMLMNFVKREQVEIFFILILCFVIFASIKELFQGNWVFATNSVFLIPISLQSIVVGIRILKPELC